MIIKNIEKNELLSDIESGLPRKQLLKKYNCSSGTLLAHIKKYKPDFTFKKCNSSILTKEFLESTDLTIMQISKKYNIHRFCIHTYINKYNINYVKNKKAIVMLENKNWLLNEYITKNKSLLQLSKELNCAPKTIKKYLKLHNISLKDRYKEILSHEAKNLTDEEIIHLYVNKNLSTECIASKYNCAAEYIRQILIKNNIERKNGRTTSSYEYIIQDILEELNIKFIPNTKKIISPYELDIFIPKNNIAIEINGVYFHSDKFVDANYHEMKRTLCEDKNIRLVQLFEDDIIHKTTIIKNFISTLLLNNEIIPAKKCKIVENVDIKNKKRFMNSYDIEGYKKSNYSIGLEYNNELIALMLFMNNKLIKYATSRNISGAFETLIENCKFNVINTIIDLNTSSAYPYLKYGFVIDKYIKPDYTYVLSNKRINKNNIKKHLDNIENATEKLQSLNKIYDSGKLKLLWQK